MHNSVNQVPHLTAAPQVMKWVEYICAACGRAVSPASELQPQPAAPVERSVEDVPLWVAAGG